MFFSISLYISLILFGLGLLYRLFQWFRCTIGKGADDVSTLGRVLAAIRGVFGTVFSAKILTLFKVLILDVILQRRILREDFLRWLMHICIYAGFMLLLIMHALDKIITSKLFPEYYSTINPFMFLRDLFGVIVIVGLLIALYRRFILRVPRLSTNAMDFYAIIILVVIMLSGIFLEGLKITSYKRYQEMVRDYTITDNDEELRALEAYWVREFAVVSPNKEIKFDIETLKLGKKVHDTSCVECHSNPRWAFGGYATARLISPVSRKLDEADAVTILLYIHFLACFLGLAYLPFSKMFHIIATPISLLANAVMDENSNPANVATRQVMELDACTHCGTCSLRCSALAAFQAIGNTDILPSEKMQHVKALVRGKRLSDAQIKSLQEGVYLCTNCDRCTVVCPSGINLRDLWFQVREDLVQREYPVPFMLSPLSFYRGLMRQMLKPEYYAKPLNRAKGVLTAKLDEIKRNDIVLSQSYIDKGFLAEIGMSTDANTYLQCFSCSTCTTSCPVVSNYDNPIDVLGLLPHQIIHSAVMGLKDLALGSQMLWDCVTCYKCQENCPQGVRVAEVLYKLKNLAVNESTTLREGDLSRTAQM
jgi:heterodisulfide reductase subunit C/nitrate reductase gamma subunit